jgi:hypothetical protein
MSVSLSILICTISKRKSQFDNLLNYLNFLISQGNYTDSDVEILWDDSDTKIIGDKRNDLLDRACGEFVVFIDDDDMVSNDYLSSIINAIKDNNGIDCIGMRGYITFNGTNRKNWSISIHHKHWHETPEAYLRTPNHISPIKREHSLKARFSSKNHGEDLDYSMSVLQYLKNEFYIDKEIYHYNYFYK